VIDDGHTDDASFYDENGESVNGPLNCLYIITDEPDYSVEFVERVNNCITIFTNDGKFDHYKVDYHEIIEAVKSEQDKALKFLQGAGIIDEDGEVAEAYRSEDYVTKEDKLYGKMNDVKFEGLPATIRATEYQNSTSISDKAVASDTAKWFVSKVGIFGHHEFFTKELWRKVKGFKNEDRAEVMAAFLHRWWNLDRGFYTIPCGMGWYTETTKDCFDAYVQRWRPVFDAYSKWVISER
jgi:hypothetical protein